MTHSTASSPNFCATFSVPRASSRAEWLRFGSASLRESTVAQSRSSTRASGPCCGGGMVTVRADVVFALAAFGLAAFGFVAVVGLSAFLAIASRYSNRQASIAGAGRTGKPAAPRAALTSAILKVPK